MSGSVGVQQAQEDVDVVVVDQDPVVGRQHDVMDEPGSCSRLVVAAHGPEKGEVGDKVACLAIAFTRRCRHVPDQVLHAAGDEPDGPGCRNRRKGR